MSLVGRHIGRYRILEELGQGGMSVVYKGLDTALDREVAVKVLHPHLSGKEESRRRLAREAKAVAKLRHPNILEVFDFASPDTEDAFIVTEYIRGQTLRQYANQESFEPPEVAAMVIHEVAAALAHAHEAGVIHRDLKPENVMVREDGVLKLMDFGIAKIIDRDEKMTMTGALVGSPAHMAPEIIEGEEAGAEADVFSLGTMLYLFATGRLPFTAANTTATLKKILDGAYDDPRQLVATLSDELAEIIATCLMRQPSARYPNASKLRDALADYLSGLGLTRPHEELASFFADPPSYRKQLVPRLTDALLARSERFMAEKRPARALASLNQVLALDGSNARALALLQQMNQARKRQRSATIGLRLGVGALVLAALGATGLQAFRQRQRPPDYALKPPHLATTSIPVHPAVFPAPAPKALPTPEPEPLPARVATPKIKLVSTQEAVSSRTVAVAKAAGPLVDVMVKIRPFGHLSVDGVRRSKEALTLHRLKLPPGPHRFQVSCERACLEVDEVVEVSAHQRDPIAFVVRLKPTQIRFNVDPPDATVRVGGESRSARETVLRPFEVSTSREETRTLKHTVVYEISRPGYKTKRAKTEVSADGPATINEKLEAE